MRLDQGDKILRYLSRSDNWRDVKLFLIVGADSLQREQIRHQLLQQPPRSLLDAPDLSAQGLLNELDSGSLFHGEGALVCRGVEKLPAACRQALEDYLKRGRLQRRLCLEAATSPSLAPLVDRLGVVVDLTGLTPLERAAMAQRWVRQEIAARGKEIEQEALEQLYFLVGSDWSMLRSEVEKLLLYVGNRLQIRGEDVAAIVGQSAPAAAWALGQAVMEGKITEALRLLDRLIAQGDTAPALLLAQLRGQLALSFQLLSLASAGMDEQEISPHFPQLKGKRFKRELERAKQYGLEKFRRAVTTVAWADELSKSQAVDPSVLLQSVVAKLCL
jgi:DNA polymerase III delta subunit